jgi:hypothetical protein
MRSERGYLQGSKYAAVNSRLLEGMATAFYARHTLIGGESGIRTHGTLLTYTRFPSVRLKPLGHLSEALDFTAAKKKKPACAAGFSPTC